MGEPKHQIILHTKQIKKGLPKRKATNDAMAVYMILLYV